MATAITGKSVTVTAGSVSGTGQITSTTIDATSTRTRTETLGGFVTSQTTLEESVSADFLWDGDQATATSFFQALQTAQKTDATVALVIDAGGAKWEGNAYVTELSTDMPADDHVTTTATFEVQDPGLVFTPKAAP